jgi:hypothetical protein
MNNELSFVLDLHQELVLFKEKEATLKVNQRLHPYPYPLIFTP